MLDIKQIVSYYPEHLKPYKRNLLREYLQYKILEILYESKLGSKLGFLGGTAIRIIHGNSRFSEDMDFDNLGLKHNEFTNLSNEVLRGLELLGLDAEVRVVMKQTFRMYLKISDVLYINRLSNHRQEKLHIQVDTEPQNFDYIPDMVVINKFDVFKRISVVPADILLAQKIVCIFKRNRPMGRDFFDAIFLWGKNKPNMDYIREKLGFEDEEKLIAGLLERCDTLDFDRLAKDVEPFLFFPKDAKKITLFKEYVQGLYVG